MKLSAYHKGLGDTVEFVAEGGHYDKAYLSKVFNLPAVTKIPASPPSFFADEVIKGGTGYAIDIVEGREVFDKAKDLPLPAEIEHLYPDYPLYPEFLDTAYGFLTRGCCNACGFCIVSEKEGRCSCKVADLEEFWRGQKKIKLLDPNLLACRDRELLLQELIKSKARVDFTQGLDARFVNDDVMKLINQVKVQSIHFAFDFMKNEKAILRGLECFNRHYKKSYWHLNCYVLTNYDTTPHEDWYRVRKVQELGFRPYVMIYQKGTQSQFLTDLQRWSNSPIIFNSTSFPDYVPRKDGKSCRELYPDILEERTMIIMATKNTDKAPAPVDTSTMSVWAKLLKVRSEFYAEGAKKTGKNLHAEFKYFELKDIVPVAAPIFAKYGLLLVPTFVDGNAVAKVVNIDDPEETINFTIPLQFIAEPAKFRMNEVQGVGAVVTYYRRYLYMVVLDLVDSDGIDNQKPKGDDTPASTLAVAPKKGKPISTIARETIRNELTDTEGNADELQIEALKSALKVLMELDPEQEDFVQEIALKTNSFTEITKANCEALINGVKEMIEAYYQGK